MSCFLPLAGIDHTGERRYGHAVENAAIVQALYPEDRQAVFLSGLPPLDRTLLVLAW